MIELTKKAIEDALLAYAEEIDGWESFQIFMEFERNSILQVPGIPSDVKIVDYHDYDHDKNYDGWEEYIWIVFEINGVLYKASGTHTSHTGGEFSNTLEVVTPVERTVIEYLPVSTNS